MVQLDRFILASTDNRQRTFSKHTGRYEKARRPHKKGAQVLNMRKLAVWLAALSAICALCCGPVWAQSDENDEDDEDATVESIAPVASGPQFPWPSQFAVDGQSFTVYPPELDRLD